MTDAELVNTGLAVFAVGVGCTILFALFFGMTLWVLSLIRQFMGIS